MHLLAGVAPLAAQKLTTPAITVELSRRGIKTARGGAWQSPQVMRLLDRLGL